jgi:hypothetical protein
VLTVEIGSHAFTVPINAIDQGLAGLNTIYTLSRDNDLNWLRDWARFHVEHHNLQAIILFDNGSTAYDLATIDKTLSAVSGIQQVRIINADLPFGPLNEDCENRTEAKFLQIAMLNLARDRFLPRCRAWLNLDVDELLISPKGENIFDATIKSLWGHLTFKGYWHYPDDNAATPIKHEDHRFIRHGDAPCPTKYSLKPTGLFGNFALQVHCLEKINRKFNSAGDRFWFAHCHGISTSWKYKRTAAQGVFSPASDVALHAFDIGFPKP